VWRTANKRINLSRPGAAVVSSSRSPRRLCAVRWAEFMYTPHNFFEAPKDQATPTPQPHQDEAAELARADRSPAAAFIALALALASLALLWFGRTLLVPALGVAVAAILVSVLAWREARRRRRPNGVAIGALVVALVTVVVVLLLWL
jgi:Flp pilus assembly protein TadB